MSYLHQYGTRETPQSEAIPDTSQVANSAGGYTWQVDSWQRLARFLILGAEGGTYYIGEHKLVGENARAVAECLDADGPRTVREIVAVSQAGRAPKNDPALFALAMALSHRDVETRRAAALALPQVARIGTHLFHLAAYLELFGGWGPLKRRAFASWYKQDANRLAYQLVKYRQRDGYTHRDLLRLAHPSAPTSTHAALYGFLSGNETRGNIGTLPPIVGAYQVAQRATTTREILAVLADHPDLPREAIPNELLDSPEVWSALLPSMPLTALIRNLPTMTRHGVLTAFSSETRLVVDKLSDTEHLRKSRVHPLSVLVATLTYAGGRSLRGDSAWAPVAKIIDALDAAFYASFDNVEPIGKPVMLALDVSGSMDMGQVSGMPGVTPRIAAAAMALVTLAIEPQAMVVGFTGGNSRYQSAISELPITGRQRLDDVVRYMRGLPFGGTDCALPMLCAIENHFTLDAFVVYTDSETWAGSIHPSQALRKYREVAQRDARCVVVGMTSNGFSIADPNDPGMLDVVGFDTAAPGILGAFCRGEM